MSLKAQIQDDMKSAMRNKETARLSTIRLLLAEMKQKEVDERKELTDEEVIAIVTKMVKQRHDSADIYIKANRQDMADTELAEIAVLKTYLPEALSEEKVLELVQEAIAQTGAQSIKDMSKVMAVLRPQLIGRADMGKVSGFIKSALQ
ncbi:GatB/YqeY domain-containing protein [Neisseria sp. Ec49-e6-T10]|uniref:GatB/YqeY domain-containing protein n=1 Tax=Neisseria sp. Ec49-e6-T10 TaxID=3140744 RepID=UPI003EB9FA2F